ncbi:Ig-like domain-containing protein [Paenibacillus sp. FJAT-26967]|uniref:OmpL47-type beta-barrel domain-containing protein n=1 Tax=Paenibacillus sp. FJAT-26967 TaxID=1729690 RepID=UPI000838EF8D|nr:Ig-like domain-containing protein [Paenibacillus sp. FJAT-26967]
MHTILRRLLGTLTLAGGLLSGWSEMAQAAVIMEPLPASANLPETLEGMSAGPSLSGSSILVTGGQQSGKDKYSNYSYAFNPANLSWSSYAPALEVAYHEQSMLKDGRVIVTGGSNFVNRVGYVYNNLARIYSPFTNAWTTAAALPKNILGNTQSTLPDGRVLIVGGADSIYSPNSSTLYKDAYLYDPAANRWDAAAPYPIGIYEGAQSTLKDGRVLVTGGLGGYIYLYDSYIYDPSANSWTKAARLPYSGNDLFFRHAQVTLPNGKVLVMGNYNFYLYDPATDTWTQDNPTAKSLTDAKLILSGSHVYVMGGYDRNYELNSTVYKLSFDFNAPTAPLITGVTADWTASDVNVTLSPGTDAESGVNRTEYSLSGATTLDWTAYNSGDLITITNSGRTTILARTVDNAGNISAVTTAAAQIDRTGPAAPSIHPSAPPWSATDVAVTVTGGKDTGGAGVNRTEYSLSGAVTLDWTAYTGPVTVKAAGITTIKARTVDNAGNVSPSGSAVISIDRTSPSSPAVVPATTSWSKSSVTVNVTPGTDAESGVNRTEYSLAGAETLGWTAYTGPLTISAEGQTTVSARSIDQANNISGTGTAVVKVDTTAPSPPAVNSAVSVWTSAATVQVTVTGAADSGSGVSRTEYSLSGATSQGWTTYSGPVSVSREGLTTVHARVIDLAGNVSGTSTAEVKIDRTLPAAPAISPSSSSWQSADARLTITPGTDTVSGVNRTEYSLAGAASLDWTAYTGSINVSAEGVTTVSARTIDHAGNKSAVKETTVRLDKTIPDPPVLTPGTTAWTSAASVPVTLKPGTDGGGSGIKITEYSLSGATIQGWTTYTGPLAVTAQGQTTVRARTTDNAGNRSTLPEAVISIDRTAPAAPGIIPAETTWTSAAGVPVTITAGTDIGGSGVNRTEYSLAGAATLGWTTYTGSLKITAEGQTAISARTIDHAGNISPTAAATVLIDRTAPAVPAILTPARNELLGTNKPSISGTAEANASVTIRIDGLALPPVKADGTGKYTITPSTLLADGAHTVTASAADAAGNSSPGSTVLTFTVDTAAPSAPVIALPADGDVLNNARPTVSGQTEAAASVTLYLDAKAVGTVTADGSGTWTYTFTAALPDGIHSFRASAADKAGNISTASNAVALTIDTEAPAAPIVLTPQDGTVTKQERPLYSGTSEAGARIRILLDKREAETVTANGSGAWTYTPASPLADGKHTLQAEARDRAGNSGPLSSETTIQIDTQAPAAPVITAPPSGMLVNSSKPEITGQAEADAIVGLAIDGGAVITVVADPNGKWSYTPSAPLHEGLHAVKAQASDAAGNVSLFSTEVSFTVDSQAPPAPFVLEPADGSVTNVSTPAFTGTSEASVTVSVYLDGAYASSVIADSFGRWSYVPAALLSVGTHKVNVQATDAAGHTSLLSADSTFTIVSSNAKLQTLQLSGITLNETVTGSTYQYTAQVPFAVTATSITAVPAEPHASVRILYNGLPAVNPVDLQVGAQTFTVEVTSQDGTTVQPYTVTVKRAASSEAGLSELSVSPGVLTPYFDGSVTSYTATVTNDVYALTVHAKAISLDASIRINGTPFAGPQGSLPVDLDVGSNHINVTVTAQDGTAVQSYQIEVSRAPSSNVTLSGLELSEGILEPGFDSGMVHYRVMVGNETAGTSVTASVYDPNAAITINGQPVISGQPSSRIPLKVGTNPITVSVTAQDGISTQSYVIDVIREPGSNAGLTGLELSGGQLHPAFSSSTKTYEMNVSYGTESTTVTASVYDTDARILVNGITAVNGLPSDRIALRTGINRITVTVTAPDQLTQEIYTVIVNRLSDSGSDGSSPEEAVEKPSEPEIPVTPEIPVVPGKPDLPGDPSGPTDPSCSPVSSSAAAFTDMFGHWAEHEVRKAADCGIVNGFEDGTFQPSEPVTRAQFVVMLARAYGDAYAQQAASGVRHNFADQPSIPGWAAQDIAMASQSGIISGYEDGTFRPDAPVTRAEMITMAARAAKLLPVSAGQLQALYADADTIPDWAGGYIAAAQQRGFIQGRDHRTFAPLAPTTRAEAVVVLLRILDAKQQPRPIEEPGER